MELVEWIVLGLFFVLEISGYLELCGLILFIWVYFLYLWVGLISCFLGYVVNGSFFGYW